MFSKDNNQTGTGATTWESSVDVLVTTGPGTAASCLTVLDRGVRIIEVETIEDNYQRHDASTKLEAQFGLNPEDPMCKKIVHLMSHAR
ncbi:hypothetical protein NPX13_g4322 [Xylaria arbuscula]|uniref:Uncharacterized protein n=1 Tax=Xylaria arbuscula TaxID=114810 RepID=A0A9W8NGJ8_9PEZI|nr:hypothetical protein NPX13_g4322 [Xylaria arbuscula]